MRLALLAALVAWVGLAEPAAALDKVKFATNWLADPEAGGFFQAVADGTYAKYGLDVTVIPGGPQTNGALMLLFGRIDFFMGGDLIGDFMSAESKLPLVAVAADFQKSPQDARWKDFFEKMVAIGMVDKRTDYKSAYTLQFVNKGVGLNLRPQ
jgi:NitT/TauT family transport system substrate-binding protein